MLASASAKGNHPQMPTSAESLTTVVGTTSQPLPTGDSTFDGLPSSSNNRTYAFGLDKPGIPQEIDGDTPVIPPTHANRTLVVCFDGAGNQFGNDNSNVVQLVALMKQDDRQQLVYYQVGVLYVC